MEEEIQARVDFKMDELVTVLKNRIKFENSLYFQDNQAFATSVKHLHYKDAFQQLLAMIEKERNMGVPCDNMYDEKRRDARDEAVDKINYAINVRTKGICNASDRHHLTKTIVSAIESAQDFK